MFEVAILYLLKKNDFILTTNFNENRIRRTRENFIEFRGRGTWHQIDCPCDYNRFIPFINPIRVLGEVKFFSAPVNKENIREFIGVIKDIQENYFLPDDYGQPFERCTELGIFFSANGFEEEAEKLAFAHNIKTISYKNNAIIEQIKNVIEEMERNYLKASNCISQGNLNDFMRLLANILNEDEGAVREFSQRFQTPEGFENAANNLLLAVRQVNSSFLGTTSGGVFLHFVGLEEFPYNLFLHRDEQTCRVYYETNDYGENSFFLIIDGDRRGSRFYFTPPLSLRQAVFYGRADTLNEKERIFRKIHIPLKINGLNRDIILSLNNDWLEALRGME